MLIKFNSFNSTNFLKLVMLEILTFTAYNELNDDKSLNVKNENENKELTPASLRYELEIFNPFQVLEIILVNFNIFIISIKFLESVLLKISVLVIIKGFLANFKSTQNKLLPSIIVFKIDMLEPKNETEKVKSNNDPILNTSKFPFKYLCLNVKFKLEFSYLEFIPSNKHKEDDKSLDLDDTEFN